MSLRYYDGPAGNAPFVPPEAIPPPPQIIDDVMFPRQHKRHIHKTGHARRTLGETLVVGLIMLATAGALIALATVAAG